MTPEPSPTEPPPGPGSAASEQPASLTVLLDQIGAQVAEITTAPTLTLTDPDLRTALARASRLLAQTHAAYLHLTAALQTRPEAVPGAATGKTAATYLIHATHRDPGGAARDVTTATLLDPTGAGIGLPGDGELGGAASGLPTLGAALARGDVSREHVDVIVSCLSRLPKALLAQIGDDGLSGIARVDAFLTEHATRHAPHALRRITRELEAVLDPDGQYDPGTYERRHLNMSTDRTGMLIGRFALDPAAGALFRTLIHALSAPHPATAGETPDGQEALPLRDDRTPEQRRADALAHLTHLATGHTPTDSADATHATPPCDPHPGSPSEPSDSSPTVTPAGAGVAFYRNPPPSSPSSPPGPVAVQVNLIATLDQVTAALSPHPTARHGLASDLGPGGGPIDPVTLSRLLCGALIHPTLLDGGGAVLAHGRGTRLATPAQRRAVLARDRGCIIPGCTAPPPWIDIHHVTPWALGGLTNVGALVAACGPHHTAIHAGVWTITMINGVPYAIPPTWLDPTRTPRRNTAHHDPTTVISLAEQLTLGLDPPDGTGHVGPRGAQGYTNQGQTNPPERPDPAEPP